MHRFPSTSEDYEKIVKEIYQDLLQKEGVNTEVRHNVKDIAATKGVIVTTVGFQSGADKYAKSAGIDLKICRSLKVIDWDGYITEIHGGLICLQREFIDFKFEIVVKSDPKLVNKGEIKFNLLSTEVKFFKNVSIKFSFLKFELKIKNILAPQIFTAFSHGTGIAKGLPFSKTQVAKILAPLGPALL